MFLKRYRLAAAALVMMLSMASAGAAQEAAKDPTRVGLSLEEALARAVRASEEIAIARGGVRSARGQRKAARAERLPQVNASAAYSRTLINRFEVDDVEIDTTAGGGGSFGGFDVSQAGFGALNAYTVNVNATQSIYTGGRISAQQDAAEAVLRSAELEVTAQNAQLVVDIVQLYYDALLRDRLLAIAESALEQTEETLRLTELGFEVGDKAEYDVLRARVARNNQRNLVVQQRAARDLAFFELKRRLDLPLEQDVVLTTPLSDSAAARVELPDWVSGEATDTSADARVAVRQAQQNVAAQEAQVRITRSFGRPDLSITSAYGVFAYPRDIFPGASNFRDDWTVGLAINVPVLTFGRVRGQVEQARGSLEQSRARLQQTRENAALDARSKLERLESARSAWEATAGTVEEAQRAYEIAQLRYQQGMSTLTEVNDARIALSQARADRAQAARDLYVAQVQLLLIRDLPLTPAVGTMATGATDAASTAVRQRTSVGTAQPGTPASQLNTRTGTIR